MSSEAREEDAMSRIVVRMTELELLVRLRNDRGEEGEVMERDSRIRIDRERTRGRRIEHVEGG